MTVSRIIQGVRVNGKALRGTFGEQIVEGELSLSAQTGTAFDFTVQDDHSLRLTGEASELFKGGTTVTWEGYAFTVTGFSTGGGTDHPTVSVSATSDFARALKEERGGKSWGKTDVSLWAKQVITAKGAKPLVQPDLGERDIERAEAEGDGEKGESTWDVLAEMAKQTGSWLMEYGNTVVLGKPSWIVAQTGMRKYRVNWESWTNHTDALTSAPQYRWDDDTEPWNGQESLTIQAIDPDFGTFPLFQARPGDLLDFVGGGVPSDDPTWLVRDVEHPLVVGLPTTLTCWRPIDPPEIIPDSDESGGSGTAGVPTGPIGQNNWQGEQLVNAAEVVKEGQRQGLPDLALRLAVATAMGESSLRNIGYGDAAGPDSCGLFQQRDTWGSRSDRLTPSKAAGFFYTALKGTPYQATYDNGGASIVFGGSYGPGKSANSASLAIHNVQRNSDPLHYARFWADAQLVVKACLDAGDEGGGSKASGPRGQQIDRTMKSYEGKHIDVDGSFGAQCVDLAAKFITDLTGIGMVRGNGVDYYNHPALRGKFQPIAGFNNPRKGDVVSWSGSGGAYANGGYGHVAIYSHSSGGTHWFLSQNPGPARLMPLSVLGVNGMMRVRP